MSDSSEINTDPVKPLVGVVTSFREDISAPIDWEVVPTIGEYGSRVDFSAGILAVPLTGDSWAQREQLTRLIESRISPTDDRLYDVVASSSSIPKSVLKIAEQARIRATVKPFAELKELPDEINGSEKKRGQRYATAGTSKYWDEAVQFTVQNYGTKSFASFNSGVRSVNPEWSKLLDKLSKRLVKQLDRYTPDQLGSTTLYQYGNDVVGPYGFNHTMRIASIVSEYASSGFRLPEVIKREVEEREDKKAEEYGKETQDENGKLIHDKSPLIDDLPEDFEFPTDDRGQFAELIIDDTLPLPVEVNGYLKRRRRPSQHGRSISNLSRLLTDPERRIFSNKVRVKGGIVVIDISGSMSLSQSDIESIVEAAPSAIIIAYSHCRDGEPNAWIFAKRGWRVKEIPNVGGQGNGVDGPVLTWAIAQRHSGEQIIWVCDGHVTTKNDGYNQALTIQCAKLVKKHRIIMVPSVKEAVQGFNSGKVINKPAGPIRDALLGKL
jgi:hypothetical protein